MKKELPEVPMPTDVILLNDEEIEVIKENCAFAPYSLINNILKHKHIVVDYRVVVKNDLNIYVKKFV